MSTVYPSTRAPREAARGKRHFAPVRSTAGSEHQGLSMCGEPTRRVENLAKPAAKADAPRAAMREGGAVSSPRTLSDSHSRASDERTMHAESRR